MKKAIVSKPSGRPNHSTWQVIRTDFRVNKSIYLLFLPVLIYYIIFCYGPMYGALIAFMDYVPRLGMSGSKWVGMKHFINFLTSPSFGRVFGNTIKISLMLLLVEFPSSIILALLLNELRSPRFSKIVQNITYLPHFISLVVICGMVKNFTKDTGIVTLILSWFGMERVSLLNYPEYFVPVYVISGIWQNMGWDSILYLAALTSINANLYEAATIDGAGKWKQLLHVTLPGIAPTIVTMFIMRIGGIMNVGYEKIILLYNSATRNVAEVISTYVYQKGLLEQSWSFSTAVNMFNSVLNLAFLFAANWMSRKINETSLW